LASASILYLYLWSRNANTSPVFVFHSVKKRMTASLYHTLCMNSVMSCVRT